MIVPLHCCFDPLPTMRSINLLSPYPEDGLSVASFLRSAATPDRRGKFDRTIGGEDFRKGELLGGTFRKLQVVLLKSSDENWLASFSCLASASRAIIMLPGATWGVTREIAMVIQSNLIHKTIVFMPPADCSRDGSFSELLVFRLPPSMSFERRPAWIWNPTFSVTPRGLVPPSTARRQSGMPKLARHGRSRIAALYFGSNCNDDATTPAPPVQETSVNLSDLFAEYQTNEVSADERYKGKTVKVVGGHIDRIEHDSQGSRLILKMANSTGTL
jgi:hypothetical protein